MIIVGDVAISHQDQFQFSGFCHLVDKPWCLNLEGAISQSTEHKPIWGTYNDSGFLNSFSEFSLGPIFLANNHIHDLPDGISDTIKWAQGIGLNTFGAAQCRKSAAQPEVCISGSDNFLLLGFGWPVIGCKHAGKSSAGVNRFEGSAVLEQLYSGMCDHPGFKPVVIVHGNYEFELYPQPGHRKLAKALINAGAYAVIFHHPHIVGPVERYQGRTIAYSLGNWAFSYGRFFGGRLKFPESSFHQVAVELASSGDKVHHAMFEPPTTVRYVESELISGNDFSLKPDFEGFDDREYIEWFRQNRVKRKGLPIYKSSDASISNGLRDAWVHGRQVLIDTSAKLGLKKMRRS